MSDLYRDTFRVLMIDQHFPDQPYITFSRFDAKDQVRRCKKAHVDSVHVTTKCHWGYCYYPTKSGVMHPGLNGRDQVGELAAEIRKAGMEAIAYYGIQFDNLAARSNPDWRMLDAKGKRVRWLEFLGDTGTLGCRWDVPCIMTGYRQYCLGHMREVAAGYDFDGLFLDILGTISDVSKNVCYCRVCMQRYDALGLDPRSADPLARFAMMRHWLDNYATFLTEIRTVLDETRPEMSLSINGGPFVQSWALLRQLSWVYGEGGRKPYNSVVIRGAGLGSPQCGIPMGDDAYDTSPPELVDVMTSTVLANGCRTFFFFLQGRLGDGTFEESKYDFAKGINGHTARKQPYVKDAVPLTAAAVYHSEPGWILAGSEDNVDGYIKTIATTIDAFREKSIPCEFLPNWRLTDDELQRYRLVVVPQQRCLGDEEVQAFTRYVEAGGNLLITGRTGLLDNDARPRENFALADLMGVDYVGVCTDYAPQKAGGYMRFDDHPFFAPLRKTDYIMYGEFLQVRVRDAQVLARVAEPVGIEDEDSFIGWNTLPPSDKADWPCVTVARRGAGQVIYCIAPLGTYAQENLSWPAALIGGIAEALDVRCELTFEGPPGASEATFFRKGDRAIVHVLNQSVRNNNGTVVPLRSCRIHCPGCTPKAARTVFPRKRALKITDGAISLPPVEIHTIVEIDV